MNEIVNHALSILDMFTNKFLWLVSFLLSLILTPLGYPKTVLTMIFVVIIFDIITKQYSLVVIKYKKFDYSTFKLAWKEQVLTSRALKNGIGVKTLLYYPVLYVAHQLGLTNEIIGGSTMSNTIYTMIFIVEFSSMLENFIACGHKEFSSLLFFVKKKEIGGKEKDVTNSKETNKL